MRFAGLRAGMAEWRDPSNVQFDSTANATRFSQDGMHLIWGADWPLCYLHETYQQALEVVRSYADFIPADQMPKILGGNLQRLVGDP